MKCMTFNVLKKNRKYFSALLGKYKCKIRINYFSTELELGVQKLWVNDISVHTGYGTNLIYELPVCVAQQKRGFTSLNYCFDDDRWKLCGVVKSSDAPRLLRVLVSLREKWDVSLVCTSGRKDEPHLNNWEAFVNRGKNQRFVLAFIAEALEKELGEIVKTVDIAAVE